MEFDEFQEPSSLLHLDFGEVGKILAMKSDSL